MLINRKKKNTAVGQVIIAVMMLLVGCSGNATSVSNVKVENTAVLNGTLGTDVETANDEIARREAIAKEIDSIIRNLNPVRPDTLGTVRMGQYKGIELTPVEKTLVSDEDVEAYIHNTLSKYMEEQDRAEAGDYVIIDFVGVRDKDGVAFEGGSAVDYEVKLGSDTLVEGFEDAIVGAGKGDMVTIKLRMPEDCGNEEIAGQEAVFQVSVNSIKRMPVLTDEFVSELTGGELKRADDYKKMVRELVQKEYEYRDRTVLYYQAAAKVMEISEFCVEKEAVNWEMDQYIINYNKMFEHGNYDMSLSNMIALSGHTYEEFRETLRSACVESLHKKILLNAIADAEHIVVKEKDIENYADAAGMTIAELKYNMKPAEIEEVVRQDLAAKLIVDNANMHS